jgi:hypothetical protein
VVNHLPAVETCLLVCATTGTPERRIGPKTGGNSAFSILARFRLKHLVKEQFGNLAAIAWHKQLIIKHPI